MSVGDTAIAAGAGVSSGASDTAAVGDILGAVVSPGTAESVLGCVRLAQFAGYTS
ncbi:hypothetical protein [Mobiluncus mulieris]|uniref:hypothetical protein n=1 Tax=Mobiluncus mulieris TaxID=2052 RepID=UPI0021E2C6AB|nr:hypothetical protein [Mobiluncus mulieris]